MEWLCKIYQFNDTSFPTDFQTKRTVSCFANSLSICLIVTSFSVCLYTERLFVYLQTLKEQVVQAIRHNKQLAQQIDKMDVTIGLLVQNRISLQVDICPKPQ